MLFGMRMPDNTRFWRELQNLGHIPIFGLFSLATFIILDKWLTKSRLRRIYLYIGAFALTNFLGGVTEIIQYFGPRDADIGDFMLNITGTMLFLGFYATIDSKNASFWKRYGNTYKTAAQAVLIMAALLIILPQIFLGAAYLKRDNAFPLILAFESSWEKEFINIQDAEMEIVNIPEGWQHGAEGKVAKISFLPAQYPGISIYETAPNWSNYNALTFSVYSEMEDTLHLSVRINDIHHDCNYEDRYTGGFRIDPGENFVNIPLDDVKQAPQGRPMDMEHMIHIMIFMSAPPKEMILFIDNIALKK